MVINKKDLLEKGAIIQRDGENYAIAPHTPAGIITKEQLRKIADVAEKYNISALKISSAQRIVLVGIKEKDLDNVWKDLDMDTGAAIGLCVRSVKTCPGTTFCKKALQDSLSLGLKLNSLYHGLQLPCKLKIGVSGCPNSCSESIIKDIGFIGDAKGFKLYVGGCASNNARLGNLITTGLSIDEAIKMTEKIIKLIQDLNIPKKRLGKIIDEIGFDTFKEKLYSIN